MTLRQAIAAAPAEACLPMPRRVLSAQLWAALPQDPALRLLALWADTLHVHALLLDDTDGAVLPVSIAVEAGAWPALSPGWTVAVWFERMIHDLWGHAAFNARDARPWLDHGHWPHTLPLAPRPGPAVVSPEPPEFLADDAEGLMQVPLGPVRDLVGEPAHLRLTVARRPRAAGGGSAGLRPQGHAAAAARQVATRGGAFHRAAVRGRHRGARAGLRACGGSGLPTRRPRHARSRCAR